MGGAVNMGPLKLCELRKEIISAFEDAEHRTIKIINLDLHQAGEEEVTTIFNTMVSQCFREASERQIFERALIKDLKSVLGFAVHIQIQNFSRSLVAQISRHPRHIEKNTGGDLGIVIVLPRISILFNSRVELLRKDENHGMLIQAKLKKYNDRFGKLTDKQKELLPSRLPYLSLLLYEYKDQDNKQLNDFRWFSCKESSLQQIELYLKNNNFQNKDTTHSIIDGLSKGKLGTTNEKEITSQIIHSGSPVVKVIIDWSDGSNPERELKTLNNLIQAKKETVYVDIK